MALVMEDIINRMATTIMPTVPYLFYEIFHNLKVAYLHPG